MQEKTGHKPHRARRILLYAGAAAAVGIAVGVVLGRRQTAVLEPVMPGEPPAPVPPADAASTATDGGAAGSDGAQP